MSFYKQVFQHLDDGANSRSRYHMLDLHTRKQFPILVQQYPEAIEQYIEGTLSFADIVSYFAQIRSRRILALENGLTRSRKYRLGQSDPLLDEIRRFQEAFGPREILPLDRVPGTGSVRRSIVDRVKTFLW